MPHLELRVTDYGRSRSLACAVAAGGPGGSGELPSPEWKSASTGRGAGEPHLVVIDGE